MHDSNRFLQLKDRGVSFAARIIATLYLTTKGYGKMLKLDLDSKKKSLEAQIMLKGEKEPLEVKVNHYELFEKDGKYYLRLTGIRTSREWIDVLVASFIEGKAFEIPMEYAQKLKMLM